MSADPRTKVQRDAPAAADPGTRQLGYEPQDVAGRSIGLVLSGIVAMLLLICAAVAGLFHLFGQPLAPVPLATEARLLPPEPRLQIDELADRAKLEAGIANGRDIAPAMRQTAHDGWGAVR